MLEFLSLGKPIHVVPQTDNEMSLARQISQHGGLLGIGVEDLKRLDIETCKRVADRARELVDGHGMDRILQAIEAFL